MPTVIRHLSKQTLEVRPTPGYSAEFMVHADGADVFIISNDGDESYRVKLEGPKAGEKITIQRQNDGSFTVTYGEV